MKYLFYIAMLAFSNQDRTDEEKIRAFSKNLTKIIAEENICKLSQVNIFPEENTITLRAIDYILGNDHQAGFVDLFRNRTILTKIYGPYEGDEEKYYYLIFYDPNEIKRNEEGKLDAKEVREKWGTYYIETLVTVIDSQVFFYRTPFFFETDIVW